MSSERVTTIVFLFLLMVVGLSALFAFPTMWLWNWLMPDIFGLPMIDFWQALGLGVLSQLLIKSSASSSSKS
jgi:hypothetical protein